jgi:hypothetical protein
MLHVDPRSISDENKRIWQSAVTTVITFPNDQQTKDLPEK